MAHCSELDNCSYFNEVLASMPSVAEMMKKRYCMADMEQCARVIVSRTVGSQHVTKDLAPNDTERAHSIIARNPNG